MNIESYEFWLTDDAGNRICMLGDLFYFSYSRTTIGFGSLEIGMSFNQLKQLVNPYFVPDRRIEVWRSPYRGIPMRLERIFLLREFIVYTRETDSMQIIRLFGRDGLDLLSRKAVIQDEGTSFTSKLDLDDDMMKAIVREQALYGSCVDETGAIDNTRAYPSGEFLVDANTSLGLSTKYTFTNKNVLDTLKAIKDASEQAGQKIYFDTVETQIPGSNNYGWTFRTFLNIRGVDRTNGIEFSLENENLSIPQYRLDRLDEVNTIFVKSGTVTRKVVDVDRASVSRWNRSEVVKSGYSEVDTAGLDAIGSAELAKKKPLERITAIFLNIPEGAGAPRCLYGVDWDLGDIVRVNYAGLQTDAEVMIVYVSMDENGNEKITGRNLIGEA